MKRLILALTLAAAGCGVDYGAIVSDAHDLHTQAKQEIDSRCDPTRTTELCATLRDATVVNASLLEIADLALDTGVNLFASANTAWTHAKSLVEGVKALFAGRRLTGMPAMAVSGAFPLPNPYITHAEEPEGDDPPAAPAAASVKK